MKKKAMALSAVLCGTLLMSACGNSEQKASGDSKSKQEDIMLTVSAAASLQDALADIEKKYEKEHPHVDLKFNFGGSGTLQRQISQGAPVDLFFSAAEDKFDELVKEGEINKEDGTDLIQNSLVLIAPKNSSLTSFEDLHNQKIEKMALGTPETVPAGEYGKQTLENLSLWKDVEPKVVYAKDVRQVLSYVETGNVEAGIVYKTDALVSDKVKIIDTARETSHDPIVYPVGVIKDSNHEKEAHDFYDYLQGKEAMNVLKEYGFSAK
ncbi:molybdate ABC transporter substrate-binding protein [Priestia endophytica]|uniref:molybdate ABC transporter substrate-binding protein n=1 Tax=Priestia endophytica TaxID=135735 RepID=UPI003D297108